LKKILFGLMVFVLLGSFVLAIEQTVTVNIIPGRLNIFSPVQNSIYESRMVPINVSIDGNASKFRYGYLDNGGRLVTLCRNCEEYGFSQLKLKPFDDGFHELSLVAIFKDGNVTTSVDFTVDTRDPKIRKVFPRGGVHNGHFEVKFQEANPKELILYFENETKLVDIGESCLSDDSLNYECSFDADLRVFDGQEIEYWLTLTDIVGRIDQSNKESFTVDTTGPIVNSFAYSVDKRKAMFRIDITEENFDEVTYIDLNQNNLEEKRLCSKLNNGACEKSKSFSKGEHNLQIIIRDEAGNTFEIDDVLFEID